MRSPSVCRLATNTLPPVNLSSPQTSVDRFCAQWAEPLDGCPTLPEDMRAKLRAAADATATRRGDGDGGGLKQPSAAAWAAIDKQMTPVKPIDDALRPVRSHARKHYKQMS
jgi:hypothetical protein